MNAGVWFLIIAFLAVAASIQLRLAVTWIARSVYRAEEEKKKENKVVKAVKLADGTILVVTDTEPMQVYEISDACLNVSDDELDK